MAQQHPVIQQPVQRHSFSPQWEVLGHCYTPDNKPRIGQRWYLCRTCGIDAHPPTGRRGGPHTGHLICIVCAKRCHAGHQVEHKRGPLLGYVFTCSCGALGTCPCLTKASLPIYPPGTQPQPNNNNNNNIVTPQPRMHPPPKRPQEVSGSFSAKSDEYNRWAEAARHHPGIQAFFNAASSVTRMHATLQNHSTLDIFVPEGYPMEKMGLLSDFVYQNNLALFQDLMRTNSLFDPFTRQPMDSSRQLEWAVRMVKYEQTIVERFVTSHFSPMDMQAATNALSTWATTFLQREISWAHDAKGTLDFSRQSDREAIGIAMVFRNMNKSKEEYLAFMQQF